MFLLYQIFSIIVGSNSRTCQAIVTVRVIDGLEIQYFTTTTIANLLTPLQQIHQLAYCRIERRTGATFFSPNQKVAFWEKKFFCGKSLRLLLKILYKI